MKGYNEKRRGAHDRIERMGDEGKGYMKEKKRVIGAYDDGVQRHIFSTRKEKEKDAEKARSRSGRRSGQKLEPQPTRRQRPPRGPAHRGGRLHARRGAGRAVGVARRG